MERIGVYLGNLIQLWIKLLFLFCTYVIYLLHEQLIQYNMTIAKPND